MEQHISYLSTTPVDPIFDIFYFVSVHAVITIHNICIHIVMKNVVYSIINLATATYILIKESTVQSSKLVAKTGITPQIYWLCGVT